MGIKMTKYQEFYDSISNIIHHPVVQEMKKYSQHCQTNCYQHCLAVAYHNFCICKKLNLDAVSAARGGMLHDLFLYDWREHYKETGNRFHALTHPKEALKNASKYFELNEIEREIIIKHMWPLTIKPPKYPETYIICLTDKYCGAVEIFEYYTGRMKKLNLGRRLEKAFHKKMSKV